MDKNKKYQQIIADCINGDIKYYDMASAILDTFYQMHSGWVIPETDGDREIDSHEYSYEEYSDLCDFVPESFQDNPVAERFLQLDNDEQYRIFAREIPVYVPEVK